MLATNSLQKLTDVSTCLHLTKLLTIPFALIVDFTFLHGLGTLKKSMEAFGREWTMKPDKRLTLWLKQLEQLKTKLHETGESNSSTNYEKEERQMDNKDFNYSTDQMAEIYAKLEVAKMLMKMGSDMAKQVETDIRFFKMTNGMPDSEN